MAIVLDGSSAAGSLNLGTNGTISNLAAGGLPDASVVKADLAADVAGTQGKILQVVQVSSKDHLSSTSTSYVDLPGVTASITPSSTDNKILIICSIAISKAANYSFIGRIVRGGSAITGAGGEKESGHTNQVDGSWWTIRSTVHDASPCTVTYLDSPSSTSSLTYKAQGSTTDASQGFGFNQTLDSQNASYASPGFSSILLMEIAT